MKYNLFIVGVQKSGTTSLYEWLIQHPNIEGDSSLKDLPFFSKERTSSEIEEFEKKLPVTLEVTPSFKMTGCVDYIEDLYSLKCIKAYNGEARVILLLRNPYDRMISAFRFLRQLSLEKNEKFTTAIENNSEYLDRSLYFEKVKNLFEVFNKENVKIVYLEELVRNPSQVTNEVFSFLGLENYNKIEFFNANKTEKVKFGFLNSLVFDKNKAKFLKGIVKKIFSSNTRVKLRRKFKSLNVSKKEEDEKFYFSESIKNLISKDIAKLKEIVDVYEWED